MSNHSRYAQFMFQLGDLGSQLQISKLRECSRQVLKLMPSDSHTVERLQNACREQSKEGESSNQPTLESIFFDSSPSQVLYSLEVAYALLMPAQTPMSDEAFEFQVSLYYGTTHFIIVCRAFERLVVFHYSLLLANNNALSFFQYNFLKSGGVSVGLSMLTKNNFLSSADLATKR